MYNEQSKQNASTKQTQYHIENHLFKIINLGKVEESIEYYDTVVLKYINDNHTSKTCLRATKIKLIIIITILTYKLTKNMEEPRHLVNMKISYINSIEQSDSLSNIVYIGKTAIKEFSEYVKINDNTISNKSIQDAITYINKHYESQITLEEVSDYVHLSKNHFCNLFKKHTGYCFSKYLNIVRINQSKLLLKDTTMPLIDIALTVGFNNQTYFSSTFKNITGFTPSNYRNQ